MKEKKNNVRSRWPMLELRLDNNNNIITSM